MKIASLRQKINESPIGKKVNNSTVGLMFEGVIRAYSLDEFINMVGYGSSTATEQPKVTAEIHIKEGWNVDTYSARFKGRTSDGKVVVYDEKYGDYRKNLHPRVSAATFEKRTEAASRTFVTIENRLGEIRDKLPGVRTEVVNMRGLKLEGPVYDASIASAIRDCVKSY